MDTVDEFLQLTESLSIIFPFIRSFTHKSIRSVVRSFFHTNIQ